MPVLGMPLSAPQLPGQLESGELALIGPAYRSAWLRCNLGQPRDMLSEGSCLMFVATIRLAASCCISKTCLACRRRECQELCVMLQRGPAGKRKLARGFCWGGNGRVVQGYVRLVSPAVWLNGSSICRRKARSEGLKDSPGHSAPLNHSRAIGQSSASNWQAR